MQRLAEFALLVFVLANASACSPSAVPPATSNPAGAPGASFSDPFAYCAAVGTIDAPDARYTGVQVPDAVARGLKHATGAALYAPLSAFIQNSYWRCMNGKVYGCFVGANLPCTAKAETRRTPTADETDFCRANPNAEVIPAAVTGRETVYEWRCANGSPETVRQVVTPDARGFLSSFWYELAAE